MKSDITAILTLYKTPLDKLINLNQYKNLNPIFFDQAQSQSIEKLLKTKLRFNFSYYYSKQNIGLSKSSNFLLNKVKTKYCLFTQPDIRINSTSINKLKKVLKNNNNTIFVGPSYRKSKVKKKNQFVKKLNAACMLCDVKKLKKIGFFDEDFFLYWEDIFLMDKVNKSKYKMILVNSAKAEHFSSQSSEKNMKTKLIREMNFVYGELVYDYKLKKNRSIKIIRKLLQNITIFCFHIVLFKLKDALVNLAKIIGILKYIKFLFFKIFSIFKL